MTSPTATPNSTDGAHRSWSRHLVTAARLLLGAAFTMFGLNAFLDFMPHPTTPPPERAMAFIGAMMQTGYFFKLVGATQLLVGVLLLINRFVPLALVLLAPIVVNIIAFHVFLAPEGSIPGIIVTLFELGLAWAYRDAYRPLLTPRARPSTG